MTYTVAILGAGIGAQHVDAYLNLAEHYDVHTVCDQDSDKASALAAKVPGCTVESTLDTVIGNPDIDIIDICLPPQLHAPVAIQSLQAGHHVVCEKPLAESVQAAEDMIAAASAAERILSPVFQYRFGHSLDQLNALLNAGLAGQPNVASLETHWNRGEDYYAVPWRGTWAGERGGAVLGHAIHLHDLISHCMGDITQVNAMLDTRINAIETEDCAALSFRTASGALVTSSITLGAADDRSRLRLVYEQLSVESGTAPYSPGQAEWTFNARDPARQIAVDTVVNEIARKEAGYAGQFLELARQLSGQPHANVSAASGLKSLELVAAIYKSAAQNKTVQLPLNVSDPYRQNWQPKHLS